MDEWDALGWPKRGIYEVGLLLARLDAIGRLDRDESTGRIVLSDDLDDLLPAPPPDPDAPGDGGSGGHRISEEEAEGQDGVPAGFERLAAHGFQVREI